MSDDQEPIELRDVVEVAEEYLEGEKTFKDLAKWIMEDTEFHPEIDEPEAINLASKIEFRIKLVQTKHLTIPGFNALLKELLKHS